MGALDYTLRQEARQLEISVFAIMALMFIAMILALFAKKVLLIPAIVCIIFVTLMYDYKYYTSTFWAIKYNSVNNLGLTCVRCGYDYHCSCDACEERRDDPEAVGWDRFDCNEADCIEQCPKCGTKYNSTFLEDLDYEIYTEAREKGIIT